MHRRVQMVGVVLCLLFSSLTGLHGQTVPRDRSAGSGDTLDNPPPLANLSGDLSPKAITIAMRKVGDWELERSRPNFSQDWTFAALYTGFMAAAKSVPQARYQQAMLQVGNKFDWQLGPRVGHA